MANEITVRISGGQPKTGSAQTVREAFALLEASKPFESYTPTINGEAASRDAILDDNDFVLFSVADKHGI